MQMVAPSPAILTSMHQDLSRETVAHQGGSGSVSEVLAFLSARLDQADTQRREEAAKMESKLEALSVSAAQLEAVQARVRTLHVAQLLSEEEQYKVEDTVADCIMCMATGSSATTVVIQMVRLSEQMADDSSFARQLRRKFITC
jgi:hypothetical protein